MEREQGARRPGGDQIKAQEHFQAVQEGRIFSHTRWAQVAGHAFAGLFLFASAGPSVYLQFCMTGGSPEGQNSSPNTSYEFQLANFACPSRKKNGFNLSYVKVVMVWSQTGYYGLVFRLG